MTIVRIFSLLLLLFHPWKSNAKGFSLNDVVDHARSNPFHFQLQHVRASDSDFYQSLFFYYDQSEESTFANVVSLGVETGSRFYKWPAEVTFNVGLQVFDERGYQPDGYGVSIFPKIARNFRAPLIRIPMRVGFGLGFSYVSRIPVAEARDFEPEESAKLTVYIDYTLEISVKQALGINGKLGGNIHDIYLGYAIVHRSTAYGLFAETGGGINYMGLGLSLAFD